MADNDNIDRGDEVKDAKDLGKTDDGKEVKGLKPEDDKSPDAADPDKAAKDKLDDEGDETPEEKAEREKAEAEAEAKRRIRIPKHRFDEVQAKARAREQQLLEEIEKLKSGQRTEATQKTVAEAKAKVDELKDKYEDLMKDGKFDDARKVRKQIDYMQDELIDLKTSIKTAESRAEAIQQLQFDAQLAKFEAQYPVINPDHDDFDEAKTNEVDALFNVYVKAGTPRAQALSKAVKYVLGEPPSAKATDAAAEAAKKRAEEARRKAADAAGKQPPNLNGHGKDSDKGGKGGEGSIDVMKLSQDKFAKLDAETLSKLRGDEVT